MVRLDRPAQSPRRPHSAQHVIRLGKRGVKVGHHPVPQDFAQGSLFSQYSLDCHADVLIENIYQYFGRSAGVKSVQATYVGKEDAHLLADATQIDSPRLSRQFFRRAGRQIALKQPARLLFPLLLDLLNLTQQAGILNRDGSIVGQRHEQAPVVIAKETSRDLVAHAQGADLFLAYLQRRVEHRSGHRDVPLAHGVGCQLILRAM